MDNGLAPLYLSHLLPPCVEDVSSYRLRNAGNYVCIHANTRTYADSFLPSTIQAWNNLPDSIRSADTLATFKYLLTQDTPKVPKYYFCGNRFNQVLHTRLRTECSSLNQHLHKRNLVGNPYCICGEVESNTHYLLTCPCYKRMRDEMVTSISQITNLTITIDVLLFDTDEVSDEVNTTIFKAVQKYIYIFIIPHVNSPYKTSIDERLIFYNITHCDSDGEYCHVFAIAAGDIIKYKGGHMMLNVEARTVRSRQETFNSNGGHEECFGHFQLPITSLFMVRNIKCGYSLS